MDPLCGGAVALWLVRLSPDRGVWVRALARDIVVVFLVKTLYTLTVLLFTQNCTDELNAGG